MIGALLILVTPAEAVHEWTHIAVGYLLGARVESLDRSGVGSDLYLRWPAGSRVRDVYLANLAPTIVGFAVGALVATAAVLEPAVVDLLTHVGFLLAIVLGAPEFGAELQLFLAVYGGVNVAIYVWPGRDDRNPLD